MLVFLGNCRSHSMGCPRIHLLPLQVRPEHLCLSLDTTDTVGLSVPLLASLVGIPFDCTELWFLEEALLLICRPDLALIHRSRTIEAKQRCLVLLADSLSEQMTVVLCSTRWSSILASGSTHGLNTIQVFSEITAGLLRSSKCFARTLGATAPRYHSRQLQTASLNLFPRRTLAQHLVPLSRLAKLGGPLTDHTSPGAIA